MDLAEHLHPVGDDGLWQQAFVLLHDPTGGLALLPERQVLPLADLDSGVFDGRGSVDGPGAAAGGAHALGFASVLALARGEEEAVAAAGGLRHGRNPGGQILGLAAVDVDVVDEFIGAVQRLAGDEAWQVVSHGVHICRVQAVVLVHVQPFHPARRLPKLVLR